MSRELPFPIAFELPEAWSLVPPDRSRQTRCGLRRGSQRQHRRTGRDEHRHQRSGLHDVPVDVAALAARQLANLQAQYPLTVLKNDIMMAGPTRQAAQLLQVEYPVGESTTTLRQIRIVNAFAGTEDPAAVAVVQLVMTCAAEVFDQAGREFGQFVASIAPAANTSRVDRRPGPSGA
jgi:hypothetical protein